MPVGKAWLRCHRLYGTEPEFRGGHRARRDHRFPRDFSLTAITAAHLDGRQDVCDAPLVVGVPNPSLRVTASKARQEIAPETQRLFVSVDGRRGNTGRFASDCASLLDPAESPAALPRGAYRCLSLMMRSCREGG